MQPSSLFTLVIREAADALALVDSGKNHEHIMAAHDHGRSSKFPLLLQHCTVGGVEVISRSEGQVSEDLCRVVLKHALFGERLLEAFSVSYIERFPFGSGGGSPIASGCPRRKQRICRRFAPCGSHIFPLPLLPSPLLESGLPSEWPRSTTRLCVTAK